MTRHALVLALTLTSPCLLPAAEFLVTVDGADRAMVDVPLVVPVEVPHVDSQLVALSGDGFNVLGQLTRPSVLSRQSGELDWELHFVLPYVPAKETLKLYAKTVTDVAANNGFAFHDEPGKHNELRFGERPVLRYMYEALDRSSKERIGETYKIYHHVYNPQGSRYVTKGPGGLFPHHRGLFYGFNRIRYGDARADIWHCRNGEHQAHREFVAEEAGPVLGRQRLAVDWVGQDDKPFAEETRELTVYNVQGGLLIEFASELRSKVGKVRLDGDPQHAGFQFRGAQDIPDKTKALTYYVRPDGKGEPGKFRNWSSDPKASEINKAHINLPWLAQSFVIDDQRYTCCYIDHPQNPKPARFSERDYGRFGSYFEYDLDEQHPLRLRYRIWLQDGEMTVDQVHAKSEQFVAAPIARAQTLAPKPAPPLGVFTQIFDGKSLDGWEGDPKFWRVEDGAIVGETTEDAVIRNGNTFVIWTGGEVADFELKLEYKLTAEDRGNSGIQYRSFRLPNNKDNRWRIGGYQADFETGDRFSGICYGEAYRGILSNRGDKTVLTREGGKVKKTVVGSVGDAAEIGSKIKKGEWNEYHIIARGNHLVHKINGVTTMELTDNDVSQRRSEGLLALQLHGGPPMKVQFKNIRLKRLATPRKIVFVAGTRSHGYGSHEHNAGCLLLAKHLQASMPHYQCEVIQNGYPQNGLAAFEGADTVVVYCDGGGRHLLNKHLEEFGTLMDQGVGLVCIHYGVEPAERKADEGKSADAFLRWIGGYFETHWSVNPHWTADYTSFPDHPITRGVKPFEINDEWYFHMRFQEAMQGVTPILSAIAPDATMNRGDGRHSGNPHVRRAVAAREPQHMAWAYERPQGGRGFGFTGGHRHWNWGDDNFRKVVLNAIVWTAQGEVPPHGVTTRAPSQNDLEANQDFPKPKPKKTARRAPTTRTVALQQQDDSHDPQRAVANLDVHPELKAQLFAAEPLLLSPSNIDVDHRGRIWVCEIVNYRAHRNRRPEGDRILILEDTDGDGMADKQQVFYQGRDIDSPHGVCVLGNQVLVSAAGNVIRLTDTDNDDKADKKELLYTGIGGAQHDHGIHAFVFGPDGKLYFNFGNSGQKLLDGQGKQVVDLAGNQVIANRQPYQEGMVFRQNLDGTGLETLGWNFRNNWMVTVDSFGTIWQSDNDDDGNRGVRINFVMEFGNYGYKDEFTGAGWRTPRTGMTQLPAQHWHQRDPGVVPNLLHTGAGSPTGITIYEGELLPESLRGQMIHCDAGPSVTRAYVTADQGAGYSAEIVNILEGTRDKWFRPSDVKVAPDGSLIVADWYDPGVGGHRMGDLDRGRLFRVVPKSHPGTYDMPEYDFSTIAGAVQALQSPNTAARYLAWTALHKQGAKAESELLTLWNHKNQRMRARALWLLGKIEGRGLHYVDLASRDENKNIRIVAIRLARQLEDVEVLPLVQRLVDDPSSAVRRECAIALRHNTSPEAADLWSQLASAHDGKDRWYLEALGIAAEGQWDRFMEAWLDEVDGEWNTPGGRDLLWRSRGRQTATWLEQAIRAAKDDSVVRYFRAADFLPAAARTQFARALAINVQPGGGQASTILVEAIRRLPASAVQGDAKLAHVLGKTVAGLAGTQDFVDLVSRFGLTDFYGDLLGMAQKDPAGQLGVAAMRALLAKDQAGLVKAALAGADLDAVNQTIAAIGNASDNRGVGLLVALVESGDADIELRRSAVRGIAKNRGGAQRLAKRASDGTLDDALQSVVAAELHRSRWGEVRQQAQKLFPLPPSKDAEPLPPGNELAKARGDAGRGRLVFQKAGTCAKCHIVNGQGKEVGPNLSEIGSKLSREAMFESILYPSAGISHNYEAYNLLTRDGNQVTGLLTSATDQQVVITSEDGIARTFPRSEIEDLSKQKVSLMPADLQKLMTKAELIDVVEYLTTLKKK